MTDGSGDNLSAADLDLSPLRTQVERRVFEAVNEHEMLSSDELEIMTMYVVGSFGAESARKGSDLDLLVMVRYSGEVDAEFDWLEYMQSDIEPVLKRNRSTLAEGLPYVSYVDPKIGNQYDCEVFARDMTQHGGYDRLYDLYDEGFISADRI